MAFRTVAKLSAVFLVKLALAEETCDAKTGKCHSAEEIVDSDRKVIGSPEFTEDMKRTWAQAEVQVDDKYLKIQGHPVMEAWEHPYMKRLAEISTSKGGNVLELGFGMAISATYIQSAGATTGLTSHHVIEANINQAARADKWAIATAKSQVVIHRGYSWDVAPGLRDGFFDGILYDTYPLEKGKVGKHHRDFIADAARLLKKGGVFTYFANDAPDISADCIALLEAAGFKCTTEQVPTDTPVIVAEYRFNEDNVAKLVKFYNMAKNFASHIIILDLWSWLTPWRSGEKTATQLALLQMERASAGAGAKFSVLDLAKMTGPMWAKQIPPFTADRMFRDVAKYYPGPESTRCLLGATETTPEDRVALHHCRAHFANKMQHGTEQYHAFVGAALARSIHELVRNSNQTQWPQHQGRSTAGTICITPWGKSHGPTNPIACAQLRKSGDFQNYYRACATLKDTVMNMSGFEFGSVFGRRHKLTVHSNAVSSVATFNCPIGLVNNNNKYFVEQKSDGVCDYTHARIGFVQHSSKAESGVFEVNGDVQISTFTPIEGPSITRTQAFAGPFKLPLTIRVVELEPPAPTASPSAQKDCAKNGKAKACKNAGCLWNRSGSDKSKLFKTCNADATAAVSVGSHVEITGIVLQKHG